MTIHIRTFQLSLKKGLLLTVIRIQGTAEARRCGAGAVRLQVITWNSTLTLSASYLPLPPPPTSSAPCFSSCGPYRQPCYSYTWYTGVSQNNFPWQKQSASNFWKVSPIFFFSAAWIFGTSLLTLFGVSLVLWRRERQITSIVTPFYCPLPPNSQTSAFLIYSCYTFKNFG